MFRNSCRCKQPRGKGTVFGPQDARHSYIILNTQMLWLGGRCSSLVRYFRDGHTRSKWDILRENILRVVNRELRSHDVYLWSWTQNSRTKYWTQTSKLLFRLIVVRDRCVLPSRRSRGLTRLECEWAVVFVLQFSSFLTRPSVLSKRNASSAFILNQQNWSPHHFLR